MEEITEGTFVDFVRKYWSQDLTYEECDTILWNLTSYPFSPLEKIKEELILQHAESGGNIGVAMNNYDNLMRREIKRLKEQEIKNC
jgi:hypothetical protein